MGIEVDIREEGLPSGSVRLYIIQSSHWAEVVHSRDNTGCSCERDRTGGEYVHRPDSAWWQGKAASVEDPTCTATAQQMHSTSGQWPSWCPLRATAHTLRSLTAVQFSQYFHNDQHAGARQHPMEVKFDDSIGTSNK